MAKRGETGSKYKRKRGDDDWKGWGDYMSKKQEKLGQQYQVAKLFEPPISKIFDGISIFVNGHTDPTADELKRLMQQHCGNYQMYETSAVTHVIASNLAYCKTVQAKRKAKIVKPSWITDSIAAGKLLPEDKYLVIQTGDTDGIDLRNFFGRPNSESAEKKQWEPPRAGNANFLEGYYANSRLHFISTWAQEMKSFAQELKASPDSRLTGRERLRALPASEETHQWRKTGRNGGQHIFMHLDMDCFFVSVGLIDRPALRGRPVAVAHSRGVAGKPGNAEGGDTANCPSTSDIASCSYEARRCGVKNGMWVGEARKLCPQLQTIPYNFERYREVSHNMYRIVASYTLEFEAVSCDEVYVSLTSLCDECDICPLDVASAIRRQIFEECKCPASTGLGPNMLVARLATKKAKPNGQFYVKSDVVKEFMKEQKLADIPGVGYRARDKLEQLNAKTCEELWAVPVWQLRQILGPKHGQQLYDYSRGIDSRQIKMENVRKSISCDVNYGIRFSRVEEADKFLTECAHEVAKRLKESNLKGQTITLKLLTRAPDAPIETTKYLGCGSCLATSRSSCLNVPTDDGDLIAKECLTLFRRISPVISDMRGVGITVQKLLSASSASVDSSAGSLLKFVAPAAAQQTTEKRPIIESSNKTVANVGLAARPVLPATKPKPVQIESNKVSSTKPKRSTPKKSPAKRNPPKRKTATAKNSVDQKNTLFAHLKPTTLQPTTKATNATTASTSTKRQTVDSTSKNEKPTLLEMFPERIDEVKILISEWVDENPECFALPGKLALSTMLEPEQVDTDLMGDYITSLVDRCQLADARSLLGHLSTLVTQTGSPKWRQTYSAIVVRLQKSVLNRYDCRLDLEESFW